MKTFNIIILFLFIVNIKNINAQELELKVNESKIEWIGKAAFNSYSLTGLLSPIEGRIKVKNNTIFELSIVVDMKSLNHENSDLKKHLRSKDFFEVKKYTKAYFKINQPVLLDEHTVILVGEMTIKGITKTETIIATLKNKILTFEHSIDRTLYGVKFNSPSFFKKLKENAIADNFILKGSLVFE